MINSNSLNVLIRRRVNRMGPFDQVSPVSRPQQEESNEVVKDKMTQSRTWLTWPPKRGRFRSIRASVSIRIIIDKILTYGDFKVIFTRELNLILPRNCKEGIYCVDSFVKFSFFEISSFLSSIMLMRWMINKWRNRMRCVERWIIVLSN